MIVNFLSFFNLGFLILNYFLIFIFDFLIVISFSDFFNFFLGRNDGFRIRLILLLFDTMTLVFFLNDRNFFILDFAIFVLCISEELGVIVVVGFHLRVGADLFFGIRSCVNGFGCLLLGFDQGIIFSFFLFLFL